MSFCVWGVSFGGAPTRRSKKEDDEEDGGVEVREAAVGVGGLGGW